MQGDDGAGGTHDAVEDRLGADRAAELVAELGEHGLAVIDAAELEQLRREASGYRKMAALVEEPER